METQCRFCFDYDDLSNLITPCGCRGSIGYVHKSCLKIWIETNHHVKCTICSQYYTNIRVRWRKNIWDWLSDEPQMVLQCIASSIGGFISFTQVKCWWRVVLSQPASFRKSVFIVGLAFCTLKLSLLYSRLIHSFYIDFQNYRLAQNAMLIEVIDY
ncbi:hypothetical protein B4U79_06964 [Dinothrombium tinctorium]|uniref:RING-CH-type domain-containing protein n=2 Tax=Dinothrombium tinctorium TaxID=1965070 RepID=A0A3S3S5T2_9ACAR|nr:hypothetical protein B4U79_11540 [Dinothrombium tinctorium]RWS09589.1 hypothetical protein B4U79_06964 [Dinothrombium tinctorium]